MTTPASIIADKSLDTCLEIVHMVRRYELMKAYTPSPHDDMSRHAECGLMRDAFQTTSVDSLWHALREINSLQKSKHPLTIPDSTSTLDSPQHENSKKSTLMHMLNMLSWYDHFNSTLQASRSTSAPTIGGASSSLEKDDKWRIITQVENLFNQALEEAFPRYEEKCMLRWLRRGENSFQCDNVIDIWLKIKQGKSHSFPNIERPKDVGEKIKEALVKQKSRIIEGDPLLDDLGFVAIKFSGSWMAENIHKMLRDGIDTWAPEHESLHMILYSPTWDGSNLRPVDALRRQFLIMAQTNMLEYVKYDVKTSSGNNMSWPYGDGVLKREFKVFNESGKTLVLYKCTDEDEEYEDEGTARPQVLGKTRGESCGQRDEESCGYPLEDLRALWHGLVYEEADWVVCLAPLQQKDYIITCLKAANFAGWTGDGNNWPFGSYVGFKTCSNSLEDLLTELYTAQYPCEAGEAAKVLGYTDEAVLDCALTYTFLKNNRLADCEYEEMLDVKGNTFVHLLTMLAQIRKITNDSGKHIDEIKKASKLQLEDKLIWSQGVERELGLHLLMFTECIDDSFLSFMPHVLCDYLYQLCKKFNSFCDGCFYKTFVSSQLEITKRLLLCEASAVVMEKGFHLLGITQKPSLQAVSVALALNYVSPTQIESPLQQKRIRTRCEVFAVYVHFKSNVSFQHGEVFGSIMISDEHGLRPLGWMVPRHHLSGFVSLSSHKREEIQNNGRLKIGNPKSGSGRSVPFASSMRVVMLLHVASKHKDDIIEICCCETKQPVNFSEFLKSDAQVERRTFLCEGVDGYARMYYILLKDAVDVDIEKAELQLDGVCPQRVHVEIFALYANKDCDRFKDAFYTASLLEYSGDLKGGRLGLTRSKLAVPSNGSLVIRAKITDLETKIHILQDECTFPANRDGIFHGQIMGKGCHLKLTVGWSDED